MSKTSKLLFGLIIATVASAASATMYKWVDEQGNTHYSQQRPPNQEYQKVAPPPPPSSSAAEERKQLENLMEKQSGATEETTKTNKEARAQQAEEERYRKNCEAARNNLNLYQNLGHKKIVGDDGVAYYPSEEELAEKISTARKNIEEYCK
jgi:hypothetical protein